MYPADRAPVCHAWESWPPRWPGAPVGIGVGIGLLSCTGLAAAPSPGLTRQPIRQLVIGHGRPTRWRTFWFAGTIAASVITCPSGALSCGSSPGHVDLVYFQFNTVFDHPAETLAAFCDRLFGFIEDHNAGRLVIDMRWNDGGNTALAQHLIHHLITSKRLRRRGALFVIIGRMTFSAAQNTVTAIESETSAIFVGEPTGSRPNFIGERIDFELPYSKVRANAADLYWQTSSPADHRTWIAPDIYAPPTFESYRRNEDPALDAILAIREHVPG